MSIEFYACRIQACLLANRFRLTPGVEVMVGFRVLLEFDTPAMLLLGSDLSLDTREALKLFLILVKLENMQNDSLFRSILYS